MGLGALLLLGSGCRKKEPVPPAAPGWMEGTVAQQIESRYPDASSVSPVFKGVAYEEDEFTKWDVKLESGYCYYFSGVADTVTAKELYLALHDPNRKRVERKKEKKPPNVIMEYCPEVGGVHQLEAKVTSGRGHYHVGVYAKASHAAPPPPPAPPPAPTPAPTVDLGKRVEELAASAAGGAERVGNFYDGSADKTDWYVALEQGKCYWFVGAGVDEISELYLYLWDPGNKRIDVNKSATNKVTLGHCPTKPGMYHFQAKVNSGNGNYKFGVYAK
jgi:hypothetical protein